MNIARKKKHFGYWMLLPASIVIIIVSIYPLVSGIGMSFTSYSLFNVKGAEFTGLSNFLRIFNQDTQFYRIVGFTFINAAVVVTGSYIIGLLLAVMLNQEIKFRGLIRALVLIPWVVPPVIGAVCWQWALSDGGIVNDILMGLHIVNKPVMFLAAADSARLVVFAEAIWKNFPFMTLTLLAGMQNITPEIYEAAHIDGAGPVKAFAYITFPLLRYLSVTASVLMFIWTLNNFENIYLLTKGGPAESTMVLPILSYNWAFYRGQLGYAAALAFILLIILTVFVLVYVKLLQKEDGFGNHAKSRKGRC